VTKSKERARDSAKAYYYLNREKILRERRVMNKLMAKEIKLLDADTLNKMLEQTEPLEAPLLRIRGKPFHGGYGRSMYSPRFEVKSANKPLKKHTWGYLESRLRERLGYAPPKPRLSRIDRQQLKVDARAIKMYHKALRKPKAFQREMERAVKDSELMEYIQGANPQ
jgi:hypothetical protein